jgi:tetratricopeptide (TPR) repeat protein
MSKDLVGFAAFLVVISVVLSAPRGYLEPDLSRASESAPENTLAEGYGHFESGRLEEALEVFEKSAAKWPESAEALQALGVTCYRLDLYSRGAEVFEALAALKPDSASTLSRLGFAYSQLNLQRDAIEAHSRAISLDPDLVTAHWGKGLAYKQLGFYEEAAKSFREVIRLRPDFAEAHYDLAEACLIIHDRCTALEEYNLLRRMDKELADRLFDLIYK